MLRRLRWFLLFLSWLILDNFLILSDQLTVTAFIGRLFHAYLMLDGVHLLNMLNCAHFRVCRLRGLILVTLIWQTLLGKHLLSLLRLGGPGIKLAGFFFFSTHHMLVIKLPWILRNYFSVIVLVQLRDTGAIWVLRGHFLILCRSLDKLFACHRVYMLF